MLKRELKGSVSTYHIRLAEYIMICYNEYVYNIVHYKLSFTFYIIRNVNIFGFWWIWWGHKDLLIWVGKWYWLVGIKCFIGWVKSLLQFWIGWNQDVSNITIMINRKEFQNA